MPPKLYHVLHTKDEDEEKSTIVSSWPTEAQAVLAARHYVIDQTPHVSWTYQEEDEKDEFGIRFSDWTADDIHHDREMDVADVTIKHSVEPEKTASKNKLEPLSWGVFLQTEWHSRCKREILIGDTFYPSLHQANTVARKDAWAILKEFCDCVLLQERTDIKEDPTGKHHFGQHGPQEKNKRSESRCYSVVTTWILDDNEQEFLLHVRPVRLAKEPPLKDKRKREDDDSRGSSTKKAREEADSSSRESTPEWVEPENDGYTYYG
jgi:hypothetical protein